MTNTHRKTTNRTTAKIAAVGAFGIGAAIAFPGLAAALNSRHISPDVGSASGLKMCFAALHKGLAAITVQSFTTAHALGVLPELQRSLNEVSGPQHSAALGQLRQGISETWCTQTLRILTAIFVI